VDLYHEIVPTDGAVALEPLAGLERTDEPDDALQAVIRTHAEEMAAREAGTRAGKDPEELHKFRVATRRIRSLLRSTRGLVTDREESERLRAELKWLASLLGEVRDRDVLIEYLLGELESLDGAPFGAVLKLLDGERDAAREELVTGLDSPRYRQLVEDLAHPPRLRDGETLAAAAASDYKRLRRTMNGLGASPTDEELHQARIHAKRARYAVEAAGTSSTFVKRAKELQDVLGEHQDAVVAEERIRELLKRVRGSGRTAFAAGRLVERQIARRQAARDAWKPAWRKLEKAGRRIS
jgi:CHAD domain-containing protein